MSVQKKGECGALCGGPNNIKCKGGEACEKKGCEADALGQCVKVNTPCPKTDPSAQQCGCDGQTYANACLRLIAGVALLSKGACAAAGGCKVGQSGGCPAGTFCEAVLGACGGDGKCVKQPMQCNNDYAPVCGCNGQTFGNECSRQKSGQSAKAKGECPKQGGGQGDACTTGQAGACQSGLYCSGQACTGDKGFCSSKPPMCPDYEDPHCGCDNKTYKNPCLVAKAGVVMKHKGACGGGGGGKKEGDACTVGKLECDQKLFCSGTCGASGTCKKKPTTCGNEFKQVCGCDNKTYSNACQANFEGQVAKSQGACKVAPGTACKTGVNSICNDGQYCKVNSPGCGDNLDGKCTVIPKTECPQGAKDPVCGCDGKTYNTPCDAETNGVNIKKKGGC